MWAEPYLAEWSDVAEWSVLDDLVGLAGVAQLGVALHRLRGQTDAGGLAAGGIRGVQIVVALENHQLTLRLGDLRGERLQDVAKHHLGLHFQLSTGGQSRGQQHFVELPSDMRQKKKNLD